MATRDDCIKAVMGELSEFISADVEALFDNAATAVDALTDLPGALITDERFDEECHSCEQPIRDHLVDGRCPTVMLAAARKTTPLSKGMRVEWRPQNPDQLGRVLTCWAEKCERPAVWDLTHFDGCSPGHDHATTHEHYCHGHALERGLVLDPDGAPMYAGKP